MKAIGRRLRRLEVPAAPQRNERGETLAAVIQAARRRIEQSGEPVKVWPLESFAGARSIADIILRSRKLCQESIDRGSTPRA